MHFLPALFVDRRIGRWFFILSLSLSSYTAHTQSNKKDFKNEMSLLYQVGKNLM